MSKLITRSVPAHALPLLDRFLAVRRQTEALAGRFRRKTRPSSRCRTPARPSGTWRTPPGSSRPSCCSPHLAGYRPFDPAFDYLFNSYYEAVGPRHPRPQRGLITRPGVDEILAYRRHVTEAMAELIDAAPRRLRPTLVELGLHHEQQHQELILMDIKHVLSLNPLLPAYAPRARRRRRRGAPLGWLDFEGGLVEIGHDGDGLRLRQRGPAPSQPGSSPSRWRRGW